MPLHGCSTWSLDAICYLLVVLCYCRKSRQSRHKPVVITIAVRQLRLRLFCYLNTHCSQAGSAATGGFTVDLAASMVKLCMLRHCWLGKKNGIKTCCGSCKLKLISKFLFLQDLGQTESNTIKQNAENSLLGLYRLPWSWYPHAYQNSLATGSSKIDWRCVTP